ncbi:MAG: peptidylprolyl isomerase [Planctomycetaceae bacterium]|nr:peptidylprolyl isomerase [Planctomycetaceae bacterium]
MTLSACTGSKAPPPVEPAAGKSEKSIAPPAEPAAQKSESTARVAETPTANTSSTPVGENATVSTPSAPSDVAAPPADATTTTSGLAYKVLREGTGNNRPTITSKVEVHYSGWTTDGKLFDSSVVRGETISFPLDGVIQGWTEGVQLMVVGEKTRFWIPADLAYGETPRRPGAPAGMLVFDIELFNIKEPPPPPPVPENVAGPPDDATVTASGLAYNVLREGTGTVHPEASSTVEVHYSGWTTDGKMFDSSVVRDEATRFPLNRVIPGWTEGLQLMVVGEKTRFWIPADLAYGETPTRPGAPAGMLVFDIELLLIQ